MERTDSGLGIAACGEREPANVGKREWVKFWRDPDLGQLELLHATFVTHAFGRHTHDTFAIGVIEAGAQTFRYRGADHTPAAGDIVLLNPGEVHTGQAANPGGYVYRMLYPDPEYLRVVAEDISGKASDVPFFPYPVVPDESLAALIRDLHMVLGGSAPRLEREVRLRMALAALIRRHADDRPPPRPFGEEPQAVAWARELLEAHADQDVSLSQLAMETGLSPFHLTRVFHKAVGMPPHAYLDQVRVARAKQLLASGLPIAQVAAEAGFADQSHLTRRFKRLVGATPGQYRAGSKNVQDPSLPNRYAQDERGRAAMATRS